MSVALTTPTTPVTAFRINGIEVDPNTLEKFAGMRVRAGQTLTQLVPDRIWVDGLDMLNLENVGEGYFVIEKVGDMTVQGTVASSVLSGPELVVKSGAIETQLTYNVKTGTSLNIRNVGAAPAFDIAADQVPFVHGALYDEDEVLPLTTKRVRLMRPLSPTIPPAWVGFLEPAIAPEALDNQDPYQFLLRPSNAVRSPGMFWHANNGDGTNWHPVQTVVVATSAQMGSLTDNCNVADPRVGFCLFNTTLGQPLWKSGSTAAAPWVDATGVAIITPS